MTPNIDLILLRAKLKEPSKSLPSISGLLRQAKQDEFQQVVITYSEDAKYVYTYFYLQQPSQVAPIRADEFLGGLTDMLVDIEISRIQFVNSINGFSYGALPNNRYAVEMDPESGWRDELFAWYDQEHLPGLASVPGCIKATRCLNLDHSPYSFAFYDLVSPEVLGCEEWLKVRHTSWSDKVRPHFTNTRRTMFKFLL